MYFIVKFFPEITIKSGPVRKRWTRQLTDNLRILTKRLDAGVRVHQTWDKLEVEAPGESPQLAAQIIEVLSHTPGIANFARVKVYPLGDMDNVLEHTLASWGDALAGKTFCVRVKRSGDHSFTSTDLERYVGGGLNQQTEAAGVKLKDPDVEVQLEVRDDKLYVVDRKYQGLGGFPVGTQDPVLSLVSGGFDSTVASYLTMKRGLRTHFCFFNLGGREHELGVKEVAYYLWNRFASSHRVKFITVPFEGVVAEILEKVDPAYMGVILKRMMLRAATQVADRAGVEALVTGEAVSQVSSQTLRNLAVIDRVTEKLVLRPLIMMDKRDIIDQSRIIGAEEFSAAMPEYCGVISVRPSAKTRLDRVEHQEQSFDMGVLEAAVAATRVQSIDAVMEDERPEVSVEKRAYLLPNETLIDIRHPDEQEASPLETSGNDALAIPFYRLNTEFSALDPEKRYMLYCEKGVMSSLHAAHLADEGYTNVGVYRPERS
jgi:thiamine biosynthesis protein ThiI